jgi:hypothetical protein
MSDLGVRTVNCFCLKKAILKLLEFRWAIRTLLSFRLDGGPPSHFSIGHLDSQVVASFVSFPMTPILSQSDILTESYDQNIGGCLDGVALASRRLHFCYTQFPK